MAKPNKEPKARRFRLTLVNDMTHRHIWMMRFTRGGLFTTVLSILVVLLAAAFVLIALTPLRNFVPGYPDAKTQRTAMQNAVTIDSLENVVSKWEFYTENLRRVLDGEDPIKIDSIIRSNPSRETIMADAREHQHQDSLLRQLVREEEKFGLTGGSRNLPIEGKHFFVPLKGLVSQAFEPAVHPWIDITAPEGSVIMAVLGGTVVQAGWSETDGYTLILQHEDDILSVYKHCDRVLRHEGDRVSAGASVALVGRSGEGDAHLHFELWYKGEAVDPGRYITM